MRLLTSDQQEYHCIKVFSITKTRLYNFDSLKPHFYTVKLGFTGVYIVFFFIFVYFYFILFIFLFFFCFAKKHRLWVLVRTTPLKKFYRVTTIYDLSRNMKKYQSFYLKIFPLWRWNFLYIWYRRVFVMKSKEKEIMLLMSTTTYAFVEK